MKKRLLSIILTLALCLSLLPMSALAADGDVTIYPDEADADGNIIPTTEFNRTGPVYAGSAGDATLNGGTFYIIKGDVTIDGNLTITNEKALGGLVLCDGATLTVKGALIHTGGTSFFIYGQTLKKNSNGTGKLVIENSNANDNDAAIRSTGNDSQLGISSGALELHGGSAGKLIDKVALYSTQSIHTATLDGKTMPLIDWRYKTSINGAKLVIEYCDHDDATYVPYGTAQHKKTCPDCGFVGTPVDCTFNGNGGYDKGDANGHYAKCDCGNVATTATAHTMETTWTDDGLCHTSMCTVCGYTPASSKEEPHEYNAETGKCTVCGFKPVAGVPKDNRTNLYRSIEEALEEAVTHGDQTVTLETKATASEDKTIDSYVSFDYPDKSIEVKMNGYSLKTSTSAPIEVENGTLTVTGEATLVQDGSGELAAPAVRVTGGKLVFTGKLTAMGANGKYAVEVTGGTLTLKEGDVLNGGVSVEGSSTYNSVNELLGEKLAFAEKDGTIINGNVKSITKDVTVVAHEHSYDNVSNTCACGKHQTMATVDDVEYDNMDTAISAWLANGGTLTLYADAGLDAVTFTDTSKGKAYTVDLNGYKINYYVVRDDYSESSSSTSINLNGANLTIQDSEGGGGEGNFGPINANSGKLKLEGGYLEGLTVPEDSTAEVSLMGGRVHALDCPKLVYTLLPDGYAMMNGNNTVTPTTILYGTSQTYDITNAKLTDITSEKIGETTFGSNTIPFALSLKTSDSKVGKMSFEWYRIDSTTGAAVKLADFNQNETPVEGVYTFNPNHVTINTEGWNGMTPGEYNVICVVSGKASDGAYQWQTALTGYKLTIDKASIAGADVKVTGDLTYDGTAKSPTVTVSLNGETLGAENYEISGNTAIDAGEHTLTVTGKGNYKDTATAKWNITPKTVSSPVIEVASAGAYNGTAKEPSVTVKDGTTEISAEEYTLSYGKNTNAGTATVTVTDKDGGNYTVSGSATFVIDKADAPTAAAGSLSIVNGLEKTYTVNLAALLPTLSENCVYGETEYGGPTNTLGEGTYVTSVNSKTGELTLKAFRNKNEEGQFGTITVTVTTANYNDITLTINVSATNKLIPTGTPTLSKNTLTYGEALSTITLSGDMNGVEGTFTWANGTAKPDAGEYEATWNFMPTNTDKYQETSGTVTITVNKATPTGAPKYTAITESGKTLGDANLTLVDSTLRPAAGSIVWIDEKGNVLGNETKVEANKTYGWRFTPSDTNYTTLTGSIELYHVASSGSGSSRPSYSVNTPSKTENGSVSLSTKNAAQGSTVTVTVQPDSGYVLEKLTVTDKNGKELTLTDQGNGKFSFVMPAGTVEIKASFTEEAKAPVFADVSEKDYYYEAVQWAQKQGITDGVSKDLFGPNQPCTRAQIVTFLWRAAGSPEPKSTSSFADVPAESYYAKAVAWAVENGITNGTASGTFSPDAPCDRAQSVTFLFRALGEETEGGADFSDVPAGSYYESPVAWTAKNNNTTAASSTTFSPNDTCTRGQIVTFLYRTYQGK